MDIFTSTDNFVNAKEADRLEASIEVPTDLPKILKRIKFGNQETHEFYQVEDILPQELQLMHDLNADWLVAIQSASEYYRT